MKLSSKSKKTILFSILFFVLFFVVGYTLSYFMTAQTLGTITDTFVIEENKYVYDSGEYLTDYTRTYLNTQAKEFYENEGCKVYIVVIQSIHGENISSYAKALRAYYKPLQGDKSTVILISKETEECAIVCGTVIKEFASDAYIKGLITDFFVLKEDSYNSDAIQQIVMQFMADIKDNKKIVDGHGKIFVSSNMDMLTLCAFCLFIAMIMTIILLKRGKHYQQILDEKKEQDRLEYLETLKEIDKREEKEEKKHPQPSPPLFTPTSIPTSLFRSSSNNKENFSEVWNTYNENKNKLDEAISEFIEE